MNLSANNSNYTVFSDLDSEAFELTIGNEVLTADENPKFLGVHFDARLDFHYHLAKTFAKCRRRFNFMKAWCTASSFTVLGRGCQF